MAKSMKNGKQAKGKALEAKSGATAADRPRARPAQNIKAAPPPGKPQEKLSSKAYEKELSRLHIELVKLQNWVKAKGLRVVVIFEGRDAAGKGGTIKRIINHSIRAAAALSR